MRRWIQVDQCDSIPNCIIVRKAAADVAINIFGVILVHISFYESLVTFPRGLELKTIDTLKKAAHKIDCARDQDKSSQRSAAVLAIPSGVVGFVDTPEDPCSIFVLNPF